MSPKFRVVEERVYTIEAESASEALSAWVDGPLDLDDETGEIKVFDQNGDRCDTNL